MEMPHPLEDWDCPMELIRSDKQRKLYLNHSTVKRLANVGLPIVVIAIAGMYRTGKSYLMNCLARKHTGFALGNTVQSKTKGIWIWCMKHPEKENCALVLIDTQGLGDPEKGDENFDMKILSLALLLSGTFIYNTVGRIDNQMISNLHFLSEITKFIKVKKPVDESDEFITFADFNDHFPRFILAVRDFMLQLRINNQRVSPNEYFDHLLKTEDDSKGNEISNIPKRAVREAFKQRNCFVFPRPVNDDELFNKLTEGTLQKTQLNPKFLQLTDEFYNHIITKSSVKTYKDGTSFNGSMLVNAAEEYVKAMNSDDYACIESTMQIVSFKQNNKCAEEAFEIYRNSIESTILPVTAEIFKEISDKATDDARNHFETNCILEASEEPRKLLNKQLEHFRKEMVKRNEAESIQKCTNLMSQLSKVVEEKFTRGEYNVEGGLEEYQRHVNQLLLIFDQEPNKGVKSDEIRHNLVSNPPHFKDVFIMAKDISDRRKDHQIDSYQKLMIDMEEQTRNDKLKQEESHQQTIKELENNAQLKHEQLLLKLKEAKEQARDNNIKYEKTLQETNEYLEKQSIEAHLREQELFFKIEALERQSIEDKWKYEKSLQQKDDEMKKQANSAQLKEQELFCEINALKMQSIEDKKKYERSLQQKEVIFREEMEEQANSAHFKEQQLVCEINELAKQSLKAKVEYKKLVEQKDEEMKKRSRDAQLKYEDSLQQIKILKKQARDDQSKFEETVRQKNEAMDKKRNVQRECDELFQELKNTEEQLKDVQSKYKESQKKMKDMEKQLTVDQTKPKSRKRFFSWKSREAKHYEPHQRRKDSEKYDDQDAQFQNQQLEESETEMLKKYEELFVRKREELVKQVTEGLEEKFIGGEYNVTDGHNNTDGYEKYKEDVAEILKKFDEEPDDQKGIEDLYRDNPSAFLTDENFEDP